jgi:hypothetical protein
MRRLLLLGPAGEVGMEESSAGHPSGNGMAREMAWPLMAMRSVFKMHCAVGLVRSAAGSPSAVYKQCSKRAATPCWERRAKTVPLQQLGCRNVQHMSRRGSRRQHSMRLPYASIPSNSSPERGSFLFAAFINTHETPAGCYQASC